MSGQGLEKGFAGFLHLQFIAPLPILSRDELQGIADSSTLLDLAIRSVRLPIEDVLLDRVVEEGRLLLHEADQRAEEGDRVVSDVPPVQEDAAHVHVVEAEDQGYQGGLPAA